MKNCRHYHGDKGSNSAEKALPTIKVFVLQPMLRSTKYLLGLIIFIGACRGKQGDCTVEYKDATNTNRMRGCMQDSLENGPWLVYDSSGQIIEQGNFENGVRVGTWRYPNRLFSDSLIDWIKYKNEHLSILTNIPKMFSNPEEGSYFVKWKNPDTAKLLTIVIALYDTSQIRIGVDSFHLQSISEIQDRKGFFDHHLDKLVSNSRKYYFNSYEVRMNGDEFSILNSYSVVGQMLVEVTVRFDKSEAMLARNIFSSILSNIFINSTRYISPFLEVKRE